MAAEGGTRAHPDHPSRPLQAHARLADRSGDFGGPLGGTRERDLGRARVRRYRELKNRSWCCRETAPAATLRNSHGAEAFVRVADLAVCTLLTNRIGAPPSDPWPPDVSWLPRDCNSGAVSDGRRDLLSVRTPCAPLEYSEAGSHLHR